MNKRKGSILVIAAHPDDEVIGCGGTIAKHTENGDRVHILIAAEGATSRQKKRNRLEVDEELTDLKTAASKSKRILGAESIEMLDFPDNRLDSLDRLDLIKKIEEYIRYWRPNTVYLHHSGDLNIDHRRIHEAVITACRPTPGHCVRSLLSYEVASSTEWQPPGSGAAFQPNWFVDISNQWTKKEEALNAYESEMRDWPHARSIDAIKYLARWRGAQVGVEAAEAFYLLRNIK